MAGERQTGPDTEMPDGLYYSERGLWDAQAPTQAEVRVVLARLARVRAQPDVAETYDCPHAEVCQTCPCSHEDDACFPGERLRAERDYWRNIAQTVAPEHPIVAIPIDTLKSISARAEQAEAAVERWKLQHERCVGHMTHDRRRMREAEARAGELERELHKIKNADNGY